jgi:4-hydroxysphinganine ceramide fatty acyl 2-hydroxylase
VLDVTTFAEHHPGGGVLLQNKNLKSIDEQMKFHHPLTLIMANSMVIGTFRKEISRIIDPEKPLLAQIWDLDHESYMKVINSPHWLFVPSPRMFQTDFCEFFSHNKWYAILVLPWILIGYLFATIPSWEGFSLAWTLLAAFTGFFFFTLTEYCLHRFVFHSEKYLPNSQAVRYLHFIMHGIHHMLPNDP